MTARQEQTGIVPVYLRNRTLDGKYLSQTVFPHVPPIDTTRLSYVDRDDPTGGEGPNYWLEDDEDYSRFDDLEEFFPAWIPSQPETHSYFDD